MSNDADVTGKQLGKQHKKRLRRLSNFLSLTVLAAIMCLILLWDLMVFTTPVGHTSVLWHRLSLDENNNSEGPLSEGVHVIWPWDKLYIYDTRLQTYDQVYEVVTADGLHVEITMTFRWRAVRRKVVQLNASVGENYLQTLLVPVVGSVSREVIARYDAEKLYSTERDDIQREIYSRIVSNDYPNGIGIRETFDTTNDLVIMEDTLIKSVKLPPELQSAIEQKLEQGQLVQGYEFRVEREKLESQRKEVEANGIAKFQSIVSPAINESYLRWRGIEATLQLAQSPNAKVVVIGNSETGLPLILDTSGTDVQVPADMFDDTSEMPTTPPVIQKTVVSTGDGDVAVVKPVLTTEGGTLETGDIEGAIVPLPTPEPKTGTVPSK